MTTASEVFEQALNADVVGGNLEEAAALYEQAAELYTAEGSPEDAEVATAMAEIVREG